MSGARSLLHEPYIWVCISAPLIGLAIIGADRYAVESKRQTLAAKAEADRHFDSGELGPAIAGYDAVIARSRGSRDTDVRATTSEAEERRAAAATTLAGLESAEKRKVDQATATQLAEWERVNRESAQVASGDSSAASAGSSSGSSSSYRSWSWTSPNLSWRGTARTAPRKDPPPSYFSGSPSSTATGIPLHVGPRGGVYHYSKSGKKVYHSRKRR